MAWRNISKYNDIACSNESARNVYQRSGGAIGGVMRSDRRTWLSEESEMPHVSGGAALGSESAAWRSNQLGMYMRCRSGNKHNGVISTRIGENGVS